MTNAAPSGVQFMLLQTDGTVISECNNSKTWIKLTPDIHGSYKNGTWTTIAPMNDSRLYYSLAVMRDGRSFVAGGEYGTGSTTSEVYNPLKNTWTRTLPEGRSFIDSVSALLPDGRVMIGAPSATTSGTPIFDPATDTWSMGPKSNYGFSEAGMTKLGDGSLLHPTSTASERYIPSQNKWVLDAAIPTTLYSGGETGSGYLLPDGRVFVLGYTHTAIYTPDPAGGTGSWVAGPDIPDGQNTGDNPAVMANNGIIVFTTSSGYTSGYTTCYEYDYTTNSYTQIANPAGTAVGFVGMFLNLPDGTVMYANIGSTPKIYTPATPPLAAGKPTISNVVHNSDGTYTLTGTGLTGITEGAAYGDDSQMATNYPIVRLTSGTNVYYAKTTNWSTTNVMTGATPMTTQFTLPLGIAPGTYSLVVAANGNPSSNFSFTVPSTADTAPSVATAATGAATSGLTTNLSVLGADADGGGESNLTYTWTATAPSAGTILPSFSANGTNAAKNTTVTFQRAGTYAFKVYITDTYGLSATSTVNVTVGQTLTSVDATPALVSITSGQTQQLTAKGLDQFGQNMTSQPSFTWTLTSGGGTLGTGGLYTAPATGTVATAKATTGSLSDTIGIYVVSMPWASTEINGPGVAGVASDSAGTFTVSGSGNDIWGTEDKFHYVYRTMDGDGTIVARVVTQDDTNASAKAGVMIRASTAKDAANAFMAITPSSGSAFQSRLTTAASTASSATGGPAAPYWVKLVRNGDTFTGYRSTNGSSWTQQGTATIAMTSSVCIGLAVTSHDNAQLCTSTFDNVNVVAAVNDYLAVAPGIQGTVNVLTNDIITSGSLSVTAVTQGAKGVVVNNGNGTVGYTSNGGAVGMDTFTYTASDGAGNTMTAKVLVAINGIQAWYPFMEGAGTATADVISNHDGTLQGGTWAAGVQGTGGLTFNGTTDSVQLPPLNVITNTMTIAGWVKRSGSQSSFAGLLFNRGSIASGFHFGSANELRYTWNNSSSTYNWNSGLIPPDGTWTFVALVITPTNAKIYMQPAGGSMTSATNTVANTAVAFKDTPYIGQDSAGSRFFKGSLDEIRIYNTSLSSTQVAALANASVSLASAATGPGSATGSTAGLSVLGSSTAGAESTLTYTWAVESMPAGAPLPTFSVNGTNAAKNTTVTFGAAGDYTFLVTITDSAGSSIASEVSMSVVATLTSITLSPSNPGLPVSGSVQLTATAVDQFGANFVPPAVTWTVASGIGSVSSSGLYTAPASIGTATVTATAAGVAGSTTVTIAAPGNGTWTNPAGGTWLSTSNWSGGTIAGGIGNTANFGTLDITADTTVTMDGARTIGNLIFGDTTPSHNWVLDSGGSGALTLDVSSGSPLVTVNNQTATIGAIVAGNEGLTKAGGGTLVLTAANTYTGATTVNAGTLVIGNNTQLNAGGNSIVAATTGTVQLNAGASGSYPGCTITVNGAGTAATTGLYLNAGVNHNAQAKITLATAPTTLRTAGSGTAQISGFDVNGTMIQTNTAASGSVIASTINVGGGSYGVNFSTTAGSATSTGDLEVGGDLLNVGMSGFGIYFNGTGSVRLTGASPAFTNNSYNKLTVNTGTLIFGGANSFAGGSYGGSVVLGSSGKIKYDRTVASQTFSGVISGNGSLTKSNTGTLTLSGTNTYTGTTTISGGTLNVTGSLSTGAVTVQSGGTLGGSGSVNGATTVQGGGILAPGNAGPGTFSAKGNLTLNAGAVLNLEVGTTSDKIAFTGTTFTAPASGTAVINVFAAPGFANGTYPVITGATGISTTGFSVGSVPAGYSVTLTASSGTLSLVVDTVAQPAAVGNTGTLADLADNDGDGRSNRIEYATGTQPNVANPGSPTTLGKSPDGTKLTLTFHRIADTSLTYTVQASDNLAGGWQTIWSSTGAANTEGNVTVTDSVPTQGNPKRFLRLVVGP